MKSEVVSSVKIDHMDRSYCYTPWGKLLQEGKHAIIAGINMSVEMQQRLQTNEKPYVVIDN